VDIESDSILNEAVENPDVSQTFSQKYHHNQGLDVSDDGNQGN
jgi:hypothetical protein